MKKADQNKTAKSLSNLENQKVDTEKVQGGMKISFDNLVREKESLTEMISKDERKAKGSPYSKENPTSNLK